MYIQIYISIRKAARIKTICRFPNHRLTSMEKCNQVWGHFFEHTFSPSPSYSLFHNFFLFSMYVYTENGREL